MSPVRGRRRWRRRLTLALGLGALILLLGGEIAGAASDLWGNVGPASQLGSDGLAGRYPLVHYTLDQHFTAVSASLTGGVDVSGVPPMIAYFLASILWVLTSFLANALIALFSFAFSLDLVNGSQATGGAGALAPVSQAIHSIYSNVFGAPWLVLGIAVVGIWAMWKALVQRRYSETAGTLALSLIYVVVALFFVAQPGTTIGAASRWTNQMSEAFLSISDHGDPSGGGKARDDAAQQLFDLLVFKPWVVLNFGGLEHCVLSGTGSGEGDPDSVAVRPLSSGPARDGALARRLGAEDEVSADGKVCVNNANKYAPHFLRFGLGTDERDQEYDALDHGDSSKLPDADKGKAGYRLGVADKPATDSMEEGGQFQRLLLAIVVFGGELGAFLLLGSLAIGIILAQILLLLLLAFAPVALVAAAIPGRGHAFFKGWLEKLAGYLLRKAAYSLILAVLLAVNGALASATSQLGWLMSFGLQSIFFWAVFLQRKSLTESLIGIATGPGTPGREGTLRVLGVYAGARMGARALRPLRGAGRSAIGAPGRLLGGDRGVGGGRQRAPLFGTSHSTPVGGGYPSFDAPGPNERRSPSQGAGERAGSATPAPHQKGSATPPSAPVARRRGPYSKQRADGHTAARLAAEEWEDPQGKGKDASPAERPKPSQGPQREARRSADRPPLRKGGADATEKPQEGLAEELRVERETGRRIPSRPAPEPPFEPYDLRPPLPPNPPKRKGRRHKPNAKGETGRRIPSRPAPEPPFEPYDLRPPLSPRPRKRKGGRK